MSLFLEFRRYRLSRELAGLWRDERTEWPDATVPLRAGGREAFVDLSQNPSEFLLGIHLFVLLGVLLFILLGVGLFVLVLLVLVPRLPVSFHQECAE